MRVQMFSSVMDSVWRLWWKEVAGLSLALWYFVAAFIVAMLGLLWDGGWHASWGRDTFFIPPHNVLYTGVTLTLALAYYIMAAGSLRQRDPSAFRLGRLQASPPIWTIFLGCLMLIGAAPFDELWHRAFGKDDFAGLWSPPHFAGMLGGLLVCLGIILMLVRSRAQPPKAVGRPAGLRGLDLNGVVTLLMLGFVTFIVGALSLNFWGIRHWYRTEGTLYPILTMLAGPALAVFAQRVVGRAGGAAVAVVLPILWIGAMGAVLVAAGYPIVVSLPIMGLPSAIVFDLFYARFGNSRRWLAAAGVVAALIFYPIEMYWAGFLNGHPMWSLADAWPYVPLGVLSGTLSALAGAWLAGRFVALATARKNAG